MATQVVFEVLQGNYYCKELTSGNRVMPLTLVKDLAKMTLSPSGPSSDNTGPMPTLLPAISKTKDSVVLGETRTEASINAWVLIVSGTCQSR